MALIPGTHIGSYEIVAPIGAGGMGEVYKARDARLDRCVAIKVLPEGFAEDRERLRRFQQEARTLSALNHPNVLTIHDLGEHEGAPYLVTELLEGETLRERLGGKPLAPRKAADLALQVAKGLAAAHEKGILHRDLKPENLFLTSDGRVKILDFGLAKLQGPATGAESETRTNLSGPGRVVGTVGYMSPEQVQGLPLDARSDLFSLGVVLWEMLAGRAPFHRTSALETQHAILKDDPPELDGALKIPPVLLKIVDTCLAKDPAARFHSAHDLAFGLESLSSVGASGDPAMEPVQIRKQSRRLPAVITAAVVLIGAAAGIAVWKPWRPAAPPWDARTVAILPFENRTGDPSLDPLGQRIVDLLRQDLQPVDDLKVAADQPLQSGTGGSARRLAEATKAHFIAGGSYYLNGGDLEIQGQLEDPWTGQMVYQLGPWKAPRTAPDPALAELRQRVGGAVAWTYEKMVRYSPGAVRPPRLAALLVYLKAMKEFTGATKPETLPNLERAAALDPDFLPLCLDLQDEWANRGNFGKCVEMAKALEARLASPTAVERTLIRMMRAQGEGWRLELVKAHEDLDALMPGIPWVQHRLAWYYLGLKRPGPAISLLRRIPYDWVDKEVAYAHMPALALCWAYHQQHDYAKELGSARAAQVHFPNDLNLKMFEAGALAGLGRPEEVERLVASLATTSTRTGVASPRSVKAAAMLELRAHGHLDRAARLAETLHAEILAEPPEVRKSSRGRLLQALLCLDRGEEALAVSRELAAEAPAAFELQGQLGAVLARLGRKEGALAVDAGLTGLTQPFLRGRDTFWRACIAANLGEKDRAVELLAKAFAQGRVMENHLDTHRNLFLEPLRGYPPYEELMKPKD